MIETAGEPHDDEAASELRSLVEGTRGLQPWRRFFHAANGLIVVGLVTWAGIGTGDLVGALLVLFALLAGLDALRLTTPRVNLLFFRSFRSFASPREAGRPSSATWYVAGVDLTLLLFGTESALAGILVLALADPAASVVGRRWGRAPLGKGTVEGMVVFLAVAGLAASTVAPPPAAVCAAIGGAAVEPLRWPLDDNLTVPLAAGAAAALPGLL